MTSHRTRRTIRVDELLKQELAGIIRDMKDPRVGFTTVMDVRTSPDLRHARVYVSVLGDEEDKQATVAVLQRARGFLRARLGRDVTLKYLPELHFEIDRTLEQAARIDALLDVGTEPAGDRVEEAEGEE